LNVDETKITVEVKERKKEIKVRRKLEPFMDLLFFSLFLKNACVSTRVQI